MRGKRGAVRSKISTANSHRVMVCICICLTHQLTYHQILYLYWLSSSSALGTREETWNEHYSQGTSHLHLYRSLGTMNHIRSRPGKPNQRKGQNEKFMNFARFCEFWCFSLGKQARFTLNFCSGMPPRKVHELTFFSLVCRGHS